jgi:hypothetical protein
MQGHAGFGGNCSREKGQQRETYETYPKTLHNPALDSNPACSGKGHPTQLRFAKGKPSPRDVERGFDDGNRECARLVLSDVEVYGGEQAGLVQWARVVTARFEGQEA